MQLINFGFYKLGSRFALKMLRLVGPEDVATGLGLTVTGLYTLKPYNMYLSPAIDHRLEVERNITFQSSGKFINSSFIDSTDAEQRPISFWKTTSAWTRTSRME